MAALNISNSALGVAGHGHVTVGRDLTVYSSTRTSFTELAVPRASEVFQGRGDVIELLDSLYFTAEHRTRKIVVCGPAGYGKTEMAKQYANHVETIRKIKKTFWVVAETTENLNKHFESLKQAYETFKDERCLFVFDNGESRTGLNQYLPPDSPNALVLITSQLHDWGDDVTRVELKSVSTNTSLEIFKKILGDRFERIIEDQIIDIIEFVEGIPLGLIVIVGDLRREMDALGNKFDIQSYKNNICSQSTLDKTIDPAIASSYEKSLRTAIYSMMNRMMRCLSAEENNFTNKILCVCAHLNPDCISMNDVKAILSELKVDDGTIARCAHTLKTFSFIFHEEPTVEKSYYHIHRTCQDIIKKFYDANMIMKEKCYSACVGWILHEQRDWNEHRTEIFMNADENKTIVNKILSDNYSFFDISLPKYFKSSYRKFFIIKKFLEQLAFYGCYESLSLFFRDKCLITRKLILKKIRLLHKAARATRGKSTDTVRLLLEAGSNVNATDDYGQTALHKAAWIGHTETVRLLIKESSDIHIADYEGQTALHMATRIGHTDTVRLLLETGSNVHAADGDGRIALHWATWHECTDTVRLLLEAGSNIHAVDGDGRIALHWAAWHGCTETMRLLLEAGSNIHAADGAGETALHRAARVGHTDTLRFLLEEGSNIHAVDGDGRIALHWAASRSYTDTLRLLLEAGSNIHATDGDGRIALHLAASRGYTHTVRLLLEADSNIHIADSAGETALHQAARGGHTDAVRLLLNEGSDVYAADGDGNTSLHLVSCRGHTDIVRLLLEAGSDVHGADGFGRTALHWAAWNGHTDALRLLLEASSNVHAADGDGRTALHQAARDGHTDNVQLLLKAGSDVHVEDGVGRTALHWAALNGHIDSVRVLLEAGSDVHAADGVDRTALHGAAWNGHTDTMRLLLEAGINVHVSDSDGQTALHVATCRGHTDSVRLLLEAGSDVHAADSTGETALHLAAWAGHSDIVRLLLQEGSDVHATNNNGQTALNFTARSGCIDIVELLSCGAASDVPHARGGIL